MIDTVVWYVLLYNVCVCRNVYTIDSRSILLTHRSHCSVHTHAFSTVHLERIACTMRSLKRALGDFFDRVEVEEVCLERTVWSTPSTLSAGCDKLVKLGKLSLELFEYAPLLDDESKMVTCRSRPLIQRLTGHGRPCSHVGTAKISRRSSPFKTQSTAEATAESATRTADVTYSLLPLLPLLLWLEEEEEDESSGKPTSTADRSLLVLSLSRC